MVDDHYLIYYGNDSNDPLRDGILQVIYHQGQEKERQTGQTRQPQKGEIRETKREDAVTMFLCGL